LERLKLKNNRLESLPITLGRLRKLKQLGIRGIRPNAELTGPSTIAALREAYIQEKQPLFAWALKEISNRREAEGDSALPPDILKRLLNEALE
jgi:hypothetical protein